MILKACGTLSQKLCKLPEGHVLTSSLTQPVYIAIMNSVLFGALAAISLSYIVLLTLDPAVAQSLASEDSLIEDLGASFCLIAAFLFLMATGGCFS